MDKINLCDTCTNHITECELGKFITFGNGTGKDNVIACDGYSEQVDSVIPEEEKNNA